MTAPELEDLIETGGRYIELPTGSHNTDRPVIVTRSDVTIAGRGATIAGRENYDAMILVAPELLARPEWREDVAPETNRFAVRTFGQYGVEFRGTPLDLGPMIQPGVGFLVQPGYGNVMKLQVDVWVRRNGTNWGSSYFTVAGTRGPRDEYPAPWIVAIYPAEQYAELVWTGSDGNRYVVRIMNPLAGNPPDVRMTFRLDFENGVASADIDDAATVTPITAGLRLADDVPGVGLIGNAKADGLVQTGPDFSVLALRVSAGSFPGLPSGNEWFDPATKHALHPPDDGLRPAVSPVEVWSSRLGGSIVSERGGGTDSQ
jgi:hypothetical protein